MSDLRASYDFCADLSRREAKNFYYSFLVLPSERRRSMCALYAFLRKTDDLADAPGPARPKARALAAWRASLDDALGGRPVPGRACPRWPTRCGGTRSRPDIFMT